MTDRNLNLEIAKAFGLAPDGLISFTLVVCAGKPPTICAKYALRPFHLEKDELATVIRTLVLVEKATQV